MIAYKNHQSTENGINETKSFFSRMKKIFRFRKRKEKINSDMVNKIDRSNTDDTNNCSKSHNSSQRSINSKSSNNSLDLTREQDNNKYEVVLPYQRFLKNR